MRDDRVSTLQANNFGGHRTRATNEKTRKCPGQSTMGSRWLWHRWPCRYEKSGGANKNTGGLRKKVMARCQASPARRLFVWWNDNSLSSSSSMLRSSEMLLRFHTFFFCYAFLGSYSELFFKEKSDVLQFRVIAPDDSWLMRPHETIDFLEMPRLVLLSAFLPVKGKAEGEELL